MKNKENCKNPEKSEVKAEKPKSKIQLFMEEMQKNPMVKIIDMKAVLQ